MALLAVDDKSPRASGACSTDMLAAGSCSPCGFYGRVILIVCTLVKFVRVFGQNNLLAFTTPHLLDDLQDCLLKWMRSGQPPSILLIEVDGRTNEVKEQLAALMEFVSARTEDVASGIVVAVTVDAQPVDPAAGRSWYGSVRQDYVVVIIDVTVLTLKRRVLTPLG